MLILLIEKLLKINQNPTTILRLAGLFNAERHPGKWFANKVLSNPNAPVNLIHLDDCIGIIEQVIKKNIWEQTFNACTDEHPSRKDFYTRATQVIGQQIREVLDTSTLSKLIDNKLLKNTLDYHFKISLNAFLQDYEISWKIKIATQRLIRCNPLPKILLINLDGKSNGNK